MNKRIEKIVSGILQEFHGSELPIPVDEIARKKGLDIKPYNLGEGISGALVIDSGKGTIGVNPTESKVRQRFTIAHELGHYELHRQDSSLFIDKEFKVLFRDHNSSTGEILKEQEANAFAAAILMPEKFLIREIKGRNFDLTEEDAIKDLAKTFNVSITAMTYRIANLFWKP